MEPPKQNPNACAAQRACNANANHKTESTRGYMCAVVAAAAVEPRRPIVDQRAGMCDPAAGIEACRVSGRGLAEPRTAGQHHATSKDTRKTPPTRTPRSQTTTRRWKDTTQDGSGTHCAELVAAAGV
eukprot:9135-Rhodomonas_salina.5